MKKNIFILGLLILIICLAFNPILAENTLSFNKSIGYTLTDSKDLKYSANLSLIKNTGECLFNCNAVIKISSSNLTKTLDSFSKNIGLIKDESKIMDLKYFIKNDSIYISAIKKPNIEIISKSGIEEKIKINNNFDWILDIGGIKLDKWAWFNSSWNYRFALNISNATTNTTNYQYKLIINNTITQGTNYSYVNAINDLRITDINNSELSFYIENDSQLTNRNITNVWIILNISTSYNQTLYFYYNNSLATSVSNISIFGNNLVSLYTLANNTKDYKLGYDFSHTGSYYTIVSGIYNENLEAQNIYSGSSYMYTANQNTFDGISVMSVMVNAKPTYNGFKMLIASRTDGCSTPNWFVATTPKAEFCIYNSVGGGCCIDSTLDIINTWENLIFIFNNRYIAIYINGSLSISTTCGVSFSTLYNAGGGNPVLYGRNCAGASGQDFIGNIDDFRVYNSELSNTSDMKSIFNSIPPVYEIGKEEIIPPSNIFINISSPINNTAYNISNISFSYLTYGSFATYNCTSYLNNTIINQNNSVLNNTLTSFYYNLNDTEKYQFYTNCSVNQTSNISSTIYFNITLPHYLSVLALSPANGVILHSTPAFLFKPYGTESDYNCSLYINGSYNSTNTSYLNNTVGTIYSTPLNYSTYSWYVNCSSHNAFNVSSTNIFYLTSYVLNPNKREILYAIREILTV